MRILVLLHDAFGGRGGIAKFNRDLLTALCSHDAVTEVVALPRIIDPTILDECGPLPARLDYRTEAAKGDARYFTAELALLARRNWFDLIVCGHLRLVRLLVPLRLRGSVPTGLILHGVDAWQSFGGRATFNRLQTLDWFLSVSAFTAEKFIAWSKLPPTKARIIPNAVDLKRFTPGPKSPMLLARYHLEGKLVLMGMARLDARERYKGFDEVMAVMPRLIPEYPNLAYLICGDGSDRARLEARAKELGLADRVVFTGYIGETEKAAHYRLADVFLLAGWGEGFGIVLIEAMACGIPSIASNLDASAEAVGNGKFGLVVNPKDPDDLAAAIRTALKRPKQVPPGLEIFSDTAFTQRIHSQIVDPHLASERRSA